MKVTVIGCGNAFSMRQGQQSFLLEEDGRKMLIDAGSRLPISLYQMKISINEIDDIYISHQHADHVGGLEEIAFARYEWETRPTHYTEWKKKKPIRLICNEQLMIELWNETLKGGLKSMEGFDATLNTFFECVPISSDGKFSWQGWSVNLIQQIHVMTGNRIMPTYGLLLKKEGHKSIYFTTDSQHCSPRQMEIFYKQADIIIQDCELYGVDMSFEEGAKVYKDENDETKLWDSASEMEIMELIARGVPDFKFGRFKGTSGVHANYAQLAGYESANSIRLPLEIKNKMWLSHYQDFALDNKDGDGHTVNWEEEAKKDGFIGFIKTGQVLEI